MKSLSLASFNRETRIHFEERINTKTLPNPLDYQTLTMGPSFTYLGSASLPTLRYIQLTINPTQPTVNILLMKLSLKSTLYTSLPFFSLFEDHKYVFPFGRFLCVKSFNQNSSEYVPIGDNVDAVLALAAITTRKSIVAVERLKDSNYYFSAYSLKGDRKALKLHIQPSTIQIVPCPSDINTVHCLIGFQQGTKIIQIDLNKMKILAQAFMGDNVLEIQVSPTDKNTISVCGNGILRLYSVKGQGYELQSQLLKKPEGKDFIRHVWLDSMVMMACSKQEIYYFRDNQLVRIIPNQMKQPIKFLSRFNKYFLTSSENDVCLYSWIGEEFRLYQKSQVHGSIIKMDVNQQEDQIVLRTSDLSFMVCLFDPLQEQDQSQPNILKWQLKPSVGQINADSISVCESKSLALFVIKQEQAISIWNIDAGVCLLKKQFTIGEDESNSGIVTGDFHPNGYSIALAFNDRIRLYHLTVQDITMYKQIPCRRIRLLKYSHGGHLLGYLSGKNKNSVVGIFNTFTHNQVMNTKISAQLQFLCWSPGDQQLATAGDNNSYVWKGGINFKERQDLYLQTKINFICFDYKTSKLLVSTTNCIHEVEGSGKTTKTSPAIPNFHSVISNDNRYIGTDTNGSVYTSSDLSFEKAEKERVSSGKGTVINYESSILYLAATNSELSLLKSREQLARKQEEYTLINKSEIIRNREKLRSLEQLIDTYQAQLLARLEHERIQFKHIKKSEEQNFKKETLKLQQEFSDLTAQKLHVEKVSAHLFKNVEQKQTQAVETLEVLYQQKLGMEKRKIMDLEQKLLEYNVNFQKAIVQLKLENQSKIQQIHEEYRIRSEQGLTQAKVMLKENQIRNQYQIRLEEMEHENEGLIDSLQVKADGKTSDLLYEMSLLNKKYNISQVESETLRLQVDQLETTLEANTKRLGTADSNFVESKNKIISLQKQVVWKDQLIKDKENKLFEYEYKIADLQKSKHVLSFRTTQIWKQFEPKEEQLDRLKKQLASLDLEFKASIKENYLINQKLVKSEKLGEHMKKQIIEVKHELKIKAAEYNDLALQIHKLVYDVEPRSRGTQILKVYQQLVRSKKPLPGVRGENQTTEQINRHLSHLEQSLRQVNMSNQKQLEGREKEMVRKMKENAELISDLNDLRKREKEYKSKSIVKDTQMARLKREIVQLTKNSSRKNFPDHIGNTIGPVIPGLSSRKRNIKSSQVPMRPVESLEGSFRIDQKYQMSTMRTRQTRVFSANRTSMVRDNNFNHSNFDRSQVGQIAQQLQSANRRIQQQDRMIDELNRRLMADQA